MYQCHMGYILPCITASVTVYYVDTISAPAMQFLKKRQSSHCFLGPIFTIHPYGLLKIVHDEMPFVFHELYGRQRLGKTDAVSVCVLLCLVCNFGPHGTKLLNVKSQTSTRYDTIRESIFRLRQVLHKFLSIFYFVCSFWGADNLWDINTVQAQILLAQYTLLAT